MESIVYKAEAPPSNDARRAGFVKIVSTYWEPYGTRDRDPLQEPIQGCTGDDVSRMMVDYTNVVAFYYRLRTRNLWDSEYQRPPEVARA
jgi:hypothetical protein